MRATRSLPRAPVLAVLHDRHHFPRLHHLRRRLHPVIVAAALAAAVMRPVAAGAAELVVCVRDVSGARGAARAVATPARYRLGARAVSLGLRLERCLADALGVSLPPAEAGNPFDLDPWRVFLLSAPDSARLVAAAAALAADPDVEWLESVPRREAAGPVLARGPRADAAPSPLGPRPDAATPALAGATMPSPPDDPLLRDGRQWGLVNLGAEGPYRGVAGADVGALAAWSRSVGSPEVLLAVADTGVDPGHPDLAVATAHGPRIAHGLDVTAAGGSWADSTGHGTAVAGVMAALTNNGATLDSLGIAGVCGGDGASNPGCRIAPIRIAPGHALTAGSFDIARAILYAVGIGARALNLSFASPARSRLERLALYYAIVRGCVVVAAAGNQGARAGSAPQYPAAYAADGLCVQVGAMDAWGARAAFSSYGPGLDVIAPGAGVWTTTPTYALPTGAGPGGYAAGSGTSLAAPFATGAIGLLAAARPELADSDFQRLLRAGAREAGPAGWDAETGWGALDAGRALGRVAPGIGVHHDEVLADRREDDGRGTLVVEEPGPGALEVARAWPGACRVAVFATVALPDSFEDAAEVWPRVGGTMAVRGDWRLPYFAPHAEVVERRGRLATFRGYLFRAENGDAGNEGAEPVWLPLPPDQARFGYTVIGPVRGSRGVPFPRRIALAAHPNPFTVATHITHAPGASLAIVDAGGRIVRRLAPPAASTTTTWDGRDGSGGPVPAGFYWIQCRAPVGSGAARVLRLE